jgi:hypothetical protein
MTYYDSVLQMQEYKQLKRELPKECRCFERTHIASKALLKRAVELSDYIHDIMYLETIQTPPPFYKLKK